MGIQEQIDLCLALKEGNKEIALFWVPDFPDDGGSWTALIGNTSSNVGLGEMPGEFEARAKTLPECLASLEAKLLKGQWVTGGWPHDADPSETAEVEYRNAGREVAEVCEIDWSRHDDADPLSPSWDLEVVRYRRLSRDA